MKNKVVIALLFVVIFISVAAITVPLMITSNNSLTDQGRCETAGGVWNTTPTPDICHTAGNVSALVSFQSAPTGGVFGYGGAGIVMLLVVVGMFMLFMRHGTGLGKR